MDNFIRFEDIFKSKEEMKKKSKEQAKEETKKEIKKLKERITLLDNKIDFMLKRVERVTIEQVDIRLSDVGFKEFLVTKAREHISSKMDDIIETIINKTLERLHKKINEEAKISKDILLSIDSEIKQTIRSLDTSYNTDKIIEEEIRRHIKEFAERMKIEEQRPLLIEEDTHG